MTAPTVTILHADAEHLPLADRSVDLVFGSPPYCDARTYGIKAQRKCVEWVEWMLRCTAEAQRVCRGPVLWVAAGVTRKRNCWCDVRFESADSCRLFGDRRCGWYD